MRSTHTCRLNIPWLPEAATEAHIVPGLAYTSLVSIRILCNAGCEVIYKDENCLVYYDKKLVWKGKREPTTKLWVLPLASDKEPKNMPYQTPSKKVDPPEYAANAYQTTSKAALIKYLHQYLFCPRKKTLLKVIKTTSSQHGQASR